MPSRSPTEQPGNTSEEDIPLKLRADQLTVVASETTILERLHAGFREREVSVIIGPSGCGKTTFLNVLAGLVPYTGRAEINGRPITAPGSDRVMVFQEDAVFPWMTVGRNAEYGLWVKGESGRRRRAAAKRSLAMVGLHGHEHLYPKQLSGGMRKRLDLARAMATQPEVILMDEPYAALDQMTKSRLQEEFLHIVRESEMTSVFVTHDLEEAVYVGDRIFVMAANPGRVTNVYDVPFAHPRTQDVKFLPDFQELRGLLTRAIDTRGEHAIDTRRTE